MEKAEQSQRLLTILFNLLLVGFVSAMFLYTDIRLLYANQMGSGLFYFLIIGLILISLLFVSYVGCKDSSCRTLRNILIQERTSQAVLENERDKLNALLEIGTLLSSRVERRVIFDTICTGIVTCLRADQSSLLLFNAENQTLRCVSFYGLPEELVMGNEIKIGEGVSGWLAKHRRPLLLEKDLSQYNFINFVKKERNITSAICVPLELGGDLRGVLNVNLVNQTQKKFDQNDLRIAKLFAQQAVLALERAVMYQSTRKLVDPRKNPVHTEEED